MAQSKNVQRWIDRIKKESSSDSMIVDALLKLRPVSKRYSGIKDIHRFDGIEYLLRLIQRPNRKILDISISLLANCLTEEFVRKEVLDQQGITPIVKLLNTIKDISIITRSCRSIANLANNSECSNVIHSVGTVQLIVKVVKDHTDVDLLTSALRALRNLANTPGHRKKLVQNGAVAAITKCLDSKEVSASASSTLSAISQSCTLEFADHMLGNEADAIKKLVKLITEGTDETVTQKCKDDSLSIIVFLTLQGCARPTIGGVGGLKCIVDKIKTLLTKQPCGNEPSAPVSGLLDKNAFCLVGSLCYCCREAINRARLRSLDALPLFVQLLSDDRFKCVHAFILNTLLCFVYDEEGLKILHENGIFHILLQKLAEFSVQEKIKMRCRLEDTSKHGTTCKDGSTIWDGHDVDAEEKFDRRHSLSCDVPTKFNQRPTNDSLPDMDSAANAYTGFEADWREVEGTEPYSPQWSPVGPSPVPEELAFASESTPAQSPAMPRPSSAADINSLNSQSRNLNDVIDLEQIEPVLDQDESSSSRDGFDQMHSPALLPVGNLFQPVQDDVASSSALKRERGSPTSSYLSDLFSVKHAVSNGDLMKKIGEEVRQASKKARIENLKENDTRLRSRSLEVGSSNSNQNVEKGSDVFVAPSSPPAELTLPDMGESVCSPSFLQFVSETCSVPPLVLRQAGRDVGTSSTGTNSAAGTSIFKQARRRRSSGGSSAKKLEPGGDRAGGETQAPTADLPTSVSTVTSEDGPSISARLPQLTKAMTSPAAGSKAKVVPNPPGKDSALAGPDPVTIDQVVLCLICHYCEMSDVYVISLAQQEGCADAFATYINEYPKKLYSKLYKILDRITSCPECFRDIVASYFIPSVAAAAYKRELFTLSVDSDAKVFCKECDLEISNNEISLDNMWHNIALAQSTLFGSNTLKRMLIKGDEMDRVASICTLLLLAVWYSGKPQRLKNAPSSTLRYLISDLQLVLDNEKLQDCIESVSKSNSGRIFECIAYSLHVLCGMPDQESGVTGGAGDGESLESTSSVGSRISSTPRQQVRHATPAKHECRYEQAATRSPPDKTLMFEKVAKVGMEPSKRRKLRSSTTRSRVKEVSERPSLRVHVSTVSDASPVLSAMFQGKYRESSEKEVEIRDVPYKAALYTIHRIYGCNADVCTVLQNVVSEMRKNSSSCYDSFCRSKITDRGRKECPVELSILKVMDLWLLQEMRTDFCEENATFFVNHYIEAEIASVSGTVRLEATEEAVPASCGEITDLKACNFDARSSSMNRDGEHSRGGHCSERITAPVTYRKEKRHDLPRGRSTSHSRRVVDRPTGWFFLNFITNHGFSDLVALYIKALLSPCLFKHNHAIQGKVLSNLTNLTPCSPLLVKSLNKILEDVNSNFETIRKKL